MHAPVAPCAGSTDRHCAVTLGKCRFILFRTYVLCTWAGMMRFHGCARFFRLRARVLYGTELVQCRTPRARHYILPHHVRHAAREHSRYGNTLPSVPHLPTVTLLYCYSPVSAACRLPNVLPQGHRVLFRQTIFALCSGLPSSPSLFHCV